MANFNPKWRPKFLNYVLSGAKQTILVTDGRNTFLTAGIHSVLQSLWQNSSWRTATVQSLQAKKCPICLGKIKTRRGYGSCRLSKNRACNGRILQYANQVKLSCSLLQQGLQTDALVLKCAHKNPVIGQYTHFSTKINKYLHGVCNTDNPRDEAPNRPTRAPQIKRISVWSRAEIC